MGIFKQECKYDYDTDFMMTSGFSFDGYKIVKYCGIVFVRDHVKDNAGVSDKQYDLGVGRALNHIKLKAEELGTNAIIGLKIEPFASTLINTDLATSGTAVLIEKSNE